MNSKYFKQFCIDRNLRKSTVDGYKVSLNLYCEYNNKSLDKLIIEALNEENYISKLKDRSIRTRLISFRNFLIESNKSQNTIKSYFSKIKSFYKHFEIDLPILPIVKYEKDYQLNYFDIPTKEDILDVIDKVPLDFKALILFMSSSGTSKAETLSLTVDDFIKGCSDYYSSVHLESILNELNFRDDIVPTIYLRRVKTGKYYYTFCSPEASSYIIQYLKSRDSLSFDHKLFPFSTSYVTTKFQRINDHMGYGTRGRYRFFRTHTLRKYHASNIGLPAEYIDALQGRQKNRVQEAYIKTNPNKLKKLYMKNMSNVMIFNNFSKKEDKEYEEIHITINIFLGDMQLTL